MLLPFACIDLLFMIIVWRSGLECAAIAVVAFHWYAWWATACFLLKADKGGGGHPGVSLFTWRPGGGGASWRQLMMMKRLTAPAHAEGGEGLNLCICLVLR